MEKLLDNMLNRLKDSDVRGMVVFMDDDDEVFRRRLHQQKESRSAVWLIWLSTKHAVKAQLSLKFSIA